MLGVCAHECIYDWKISYENQPQNRLHAKNFNFLTASFVKKTNNFISISDDNLLRLFTEDDNVAGQNEIEKDIVLKECKLLKFSRHFISACKKKKNSGSLTSNTNIVNEKNLNANINVTGPITGTSALRIYRGMQTNNYNFEEITGHLGETTRLRTNIQENLIFTSGTDGCVIIYSAYGGTDISDEDKELNAEKTMLSKYTEIVSIKKTMLAEKLNENDTIPQKQEEVLKKFRSRIQDDKEFLHKENDSLKNKLSSMKQHEQKITSQKQFELDQLNLDYNHTIETEKTQFAQDLENTKNLNQIELSEKQRLIEKGRDDLKQQRDDNNDKVQNVIRISEDNIRRIREVNDAEVYKSEKLKKDLQDFIDKLNVEKELDDQTMDWLNSRILDVLTSNIQELKNGIEDMKNQNGNQLKKLRDTISQKNQDSDNLERELKSLEEEKTKGENAKIELLKSKAVIN